MLLLDTCALIWLSEGLTLETTARSAIEEAASADKVLVSAISFWEVGFLTQRKRAPVIIEPSPRSWLRRVLDLPGVRALPLTPAAALDSAFLPEPFHRDPADRLLVAQARELDLPIVTRDRRILDYAARGHVRVIAC